MSTELPTEASNLTPDAHPDPAAAALQRIRIVLVETSHPGNVGAVARAMKVMGLRNLYLVSPRRFPAAEATARAAGADDLLVNAVICESLGEAIGECRTVVGTSARSRHISWPVDEPAECAQFVMAQDNGGVAFVFGRESSGLRNEELDRCNRVVMIPTAPDFRSLNLGAAVQIVGYELRRCALAKVQSTPRNSAAQDDKPSTPSGLVRSDGEVVDALASASELEGLFSHFERALTYSGYLDPKAPRLLMRRLHRLFGRADLLRTEVNILRGVLSSMESMAPADYGKAKSDETDSGPDSG